MERVCRIIHSDLPHGEGIMGEHAAVAIFDTGIASHMDFQNRILHFQDFVNKRIGSYDDNGHGTHLAGIIGGSGAQSNGLYHGVAPCCKYVIVKVLDAMGNGDTADVLRAVDWVIKNKERFQIRYLNISIGMIPGAREKEQSELTEAIGQLWNHGICVVAASGNNGPSDSSVTIPGTLPEVITVGSLDDNDRRLLKGSMKIGYSGRGPTDICVAKPEILAPGTHIVSCSSRGGYISKSGSSMATAVVTGGLAVLGDMYPDFQPCDLKLFLYSKLKRQKGRPGWGAFDFADLM